MDKFPQHPKVIDLLEFKRRFGGKALSRRPSPPPVPAELADLKEAAGTFYEDVSLAWLGRFGATADFLSNRSEEGEPLTEAEVIAFVNVQAEMGHAFQKLKEMCQIIEQVNAALARFEAFKDKKNHHPETGAGRGHPPK